MEVSNVLRDITRNGVDIISNRKCAVCQTEDGHETHKNVAYIYSDNLVKMCDRLPKTPKRASVVHFLVEAYGFLKHMRLVSPSPAKEDDLMLFHTQDYIDCLKRLSDREDDEKYEDGDELFGLTYDCPVFPGAHDYASLIAGGSIKAAECLASRQSDIAIHWTGGWHHASRDEASGYCYYNDIVIAILKLRQSFDRVLYVDIDLHHGDGVESAFCVTSKVLTVSFHKYSAGFFPGTGKVEDIGIGKGCYYAVNVPLKDGMQDPQYIDVFKRVMNTVHERFQPQAVVCQCGADSLASDPMNSFNLTPQAHVQCVQYLMEWNLPLLLVGGGGYHTPNTARCWASVTGAVLGQALSDDIPEHKYFLIYGPDYQVNLTQGNRVDENTQEYLESVISRVIENLQCIEVS